MEITSCGNIKKERDQVNRTDRVADFDLKKQTFAEENKTANL